MRGLLAIVVALISLAAAQGAAAQTAAGDWVGVIVIGPGRTLREVIHIRKTEAGAYTGIIDYHAAGDREPMAKPSLATHTPQPRSKDKLRVGCIGA